MLTMTVTKISGDKVTVKDDKGKLMIIIIDTRTYLKVGDKVSVENGKIMTTSGGGSPPGPPRPPGPH